MKYKQCQQIRSSSISSSSRLRVRREVCRSSRRVRRRVCVRSRGSRPPRRPRGCCRPRRAPSEAGGRQWAPAAPVGTHHTVTARRPRGCCRLRRAPSEAGGRQWAPAAPVHHTSYIHGAVSLRVQVYTLVYFHATNGLRSSRILHSCNAN